MTLNNQPGTLSHVDFQNINFHGTLNWLVRRALETYYNAKTKGLRPDDFINVNVSTYSNTAATGAVKPSVWRIDDPGRVRVKAKAFQKYTLYNTGSTVAYVTKIDSWAKRHLRCSDGGGQAPSNSSRNETAMILAVVADELAGKTPAGSGCVRVWEPLYTALGTPWYMPPSFQNDPFKNLNIFVALRNWNARMQFMPWWHARRQFQLNTNNQTAGYVINELGQGRRTATGVAAMGTAGTVDTWQTSNTASGTFIPAGSVEGGGLIGPDSNWSYATTWSSFKNGPAGTVMDWRSTQDQPVPTSNTALTTEGFRFFPEYKEEKKGVMDRWFKRRSRRLMPIGPGSSFSFKTRSRATIAPWRMALPGVSGALNSYNEASFLWRGAMGASGSTPATGSMGMGFGLALSNGAGTQPGVFFQAGNQTAATPSRLLYNKKTDPMGSPGTSGVTTLVLRGNFVPHLAGVGPGTGGDFVNAGPAQLMVKRETFWAVKIYLTKRTEPNKPFMVTNDAYYDTDISQYVNFFKTSPAQAAPITEAQV